MIHRTQGAFASLFILCGMLMISSAQAQSVTFGSLNDGLGSFNTSTPAITQSWTTTTDSVRYRSDDNGTLNSSLLRNFTLNRSTGYAYRIEGSLTLTEGYADDNNRVGMYFFGDATEVPNENETGAIGLIFNFDDGVTGGAPGSNADDDLDLLVGIDNGSLAGSVSRNETGTAFAQDLFGTTISFSTDLSFYNDGSDDRIQIDGRLIDADGYVTSVSTSVLASEYTGDFFGFVTRSRARNFAGDPADPTNQESPMVVDYRTFSLTQTAVPEPSTVLFITTAALGLLYYRKRHASAGC